MRHWAVKYIGMPYSLGARGPKKVDCWGLLWLIYKNDFNIELPQYPGIALASMVVVNSSIRQAVQSDWVEVEKPFDGAAVGMGYRNALHHVGIWAGPDGGKVVHSWQGHNAVADTLAAIGQKGLQNVKFFKHIKWPTS